MKLVFKFLPVLALSLAINIGLNADVATAQGAPQVSVVNLSVQPGTNGGQMVLTPRGVLVPLPGAGVNSNAVQIYMGSTGGFWYVDRTGQTIDLTAYVEQVRRMAGQAQPQQVAPPQYAPYPTTYPEQTTNNTTTNNSGGNGVATAAAAGLGAMAGAAMGTMATNPYYNNVPYGTRMYYGNDGRPYYNNENGKNVFVNDDGDVKWNNVYAANNIQKSRQEQQISQAQAVNQQRQATQTQQRQAQAQQYQAAQTPPQQGRMQEASAQNSQRFQQQQNWYQEQSHNPERAKAFQQSASGANPFVRGADAGGFGQRAEAAGRRGVDRAGAFGGARAGVGRGGGGRRLR